MVRLVDLNFFVSEFDGYLGSKESDVGEVQSEDGFMNVVVKNDLRLSRANITFYMGFHCSSYHLHDLSFD